jgi:hypothetical protein
VNNCPLSTDYPNGCIDPQDQEKKCTLPKSYRLNVAAQFPGILHFGGLTKKEFTGLEVWNKLSTVEQTQRKAQAKNFLKCRGLQKDACNQDQTLEPIEVSCETPVSSKIIIKAAGAEL